MRRSEVMTGPGKSAESLQRGADGPSVQAPPPPTEEGNPEIMILEPSPFCSE